MSKKKLIITSILVVVITTILLVLPGCQFWTKKYGGTTTVNLPKGKKLVPYTVQWETRNSSLWYLTEDAEPGYTPKTYEFNETSNMGVLEGKIIFQEH